MVTTTGEHMFNSKKIKDLEARIEKLESQVEYGYYRSIDELGFATSLWTSSQRQLPLKTVVSDIMKHLRLAYTHVQETDQLTKKKG